MNNLLNYHIIGITGIIGAGKSFLSHKLKSQYHANIIEIDDIRRDMLWQSLSQDSVNLRKELIKEFHITTYNKNYFFDRTNFTKKIFSSEIILQKFNSLCKPYFCTSIKERIKTNSLNCIVWVNLIEDYYVDLIEHLVFIDISEHQWLKYNQNNLTFMLERYNMQTEMIEKKKLLQQLSISYEVYSNE